LDINDLLCIPYDSGFYYSNSGFQLSFICYQAAERIRYCHPELVSGSHNVLILRDAEINSA
jgi:hypothetical protein